MSVAGSVSVSSKRDVFVWTLSAAVLQAELNAAKEAVREKRHMLFSPPFDRLRCTETQSQLCPDMLVSSREYKQEGVAWGWPSGLRWSLLEDMSSSDNLKITITLLAGKTSSPPRIPPEFFNHKIYCDVAFILPAARSCILAAKPVVARQCAHLHNLLYSNFAEGSAVRNPHELEWPRLPQDFHVGDFDDFAEYAEQEVESGIGQGEATEGAKGEEAERDDEASTGDARVNSTSAEAGPAVPLQEDAAGGAADRAYHRVEVPDCSYTTLFAFLWYLYDDEVRFTPSRAIAVASPDKDSYDRPNDLNTAWQTHLDSGPRCDAHAIYRVADRYLQEDLRKLAKEHIVNSLTPETAFSSLSRTYSDAQDAIVQFIINNIEDVRKSKGWSRSIELLNDGHLIGGAVILNKILDGVVAAQEAKK